MYRRQPDRALERHFRTVLDHATDGVLIESGDRLAYINPAYAQLLGYPSTSELESACIRDIAHPEDFERLTWFGRCRSEGKPAPTRYTFRARARTGSIITLDASISIARADGDLLITTIVRELAQQVETAARDDVVLELPGIKPLSPREAEIVRHLLAGRRSKEIALILDVSEKTIDTHRSRAFQKLAVRGIGDLFRVAAEHGLFPH